MSTCFQFSKIAKLLQAILIQGDCCFESVSSDTRTLKPGELFAALSGEQFDGHDFVEKAKRGGAVGALVSRRCEVDIPQLCVKDTLSALTTLAALRRNQCNIPVIGLTGSCGKTTTKMLLATILQQAGSTLATEGTLNNHIGVPLTLMRLNESHRFAVIEMGANHIGEIAHLTHIAKPTVAAITNVHPVHVEGFGNLNNIAAAKGEIFQGLDDEGIAVLNRDDPFYTQWQEECRTYKMLTFGVHPDAEVSATACRLDENDRAQFTLCIGNKQVKVTLPLLGLHNIGNALAAAACAYAAGIDIHTIQRGLTSAKAVDKRLQKRAGQNGSLLLDDSYNANPASVEAALQVLLRAKGKHFCILGEMLELGDKAAQIHAEMGKRFREAGIERVFTVGALTQHTVKQFGEGALYFTDRTRLVETVKPLLSEEVAVLVKGSNCNRMWEFVQALSA
ncbi:MAG: murF [Gammaproteobacteria bacterium]|jgi:UDP-N-acetylmuramoyl-tripeptide--D-alanyl-D-alanine ligase|nr:murF [Gammaproteobacteria bacterium]